MSADYDVEDSSGYDGLPGDTSVLKGIGAIVNQDQVARGLNLDEIERALVQETPVQESQTQISRANQLIYELSRQYNVNIDDVAPPELVERATRSTQRSSPSIYGASESPNYQRSTPDRTQSSPAPESRSRYSASPNYATPTIIDNRSDDNDDDEDDGDVGNGRRFITRGSSYANGALTPAANGQSQMNPQFMDQESYERMEDEKASMIADIEDLIRDLELEGADLSRIERPTHDSPYVNVQRTLKILQKKSDKSRCASLAEEAIIFGAIALGEIFDGTHQFLGYSPNLSGFDNTVRVKLRRTRHETGQIVSNILQDNSLGPITRICMELIPSAFIHARNNQMNHGQPNMYDDSRTIAINTRLNQS